MSATMVLGETYVPPRTHQTGDSYDSIHDIRIGETWPVPSPSAGVITQSVFVSLTNSVACLRWYGQHDARTQRCRASFRRVS